MSPINSNHRTRQGKINLAHRHLTEWPNFIDDIGINITLKTIQIQAKFADQARFGVS